MQKFRQSALQLDLCTSLVKTSNQCTLASLGKVVVTLHNGYFGKVFNFEGILVILQILRGFGNLEKSYLGVVRQFSQYFIKPKPSDNRRFSSSA